MFQVKIRVPAAIVVVGQLIGWSQGVGVFSAGLLLFQVCELKLHTCGGLMVLGGKGRDWGKQARRGRASATGRS